MMICVYCYWHQSALILIRLLRAIFKHLSEGTFLTKGTFDLLSETMVVLAFGFEIILAFGADFFCKVYQTCGTLVMFRKPFTLKENNLARLSPSILCPFLLAWNETTFGK